MFLNQNLGKVATLLVIIVFLCSAMQSSVSQNSAFEDRVLSYSSKTNSTEASLSNAQHHASIRLKENDEDFGDGHICSGVVVGPSVVLTTAQCIYNYNKDKPYHPSELSIVLASISRYQRQKQTLVYSVTHSYVPRTFNALNLKDNVAILMLESDIPEISEFVKPITLSHTRTTNTNWYDKTSGAKFKVTTWLQTTEGLSLNHLMMINASKVSDDTCMQYYGRSVFNSGMLCVISSESLNKDFGSPLFVDNKLVGLRSFAAGPLSPVIYTDISHYEKWIRDIIGDGSNQNGSVWGTLGILLLTFVAFKRTKFMK